MGEELNRWSRKRRQQRRATWILPVVLIALGCASSAAVSEPGADAMAARSSAASTEPGSAVVDMSTAVAVRSVEVVERAGGAAILVSGDGPLVWTGFRDDAGRLAVELPDTFPSVDLGERVPGTGLIAGVAIGEERRGARSITRLTIDTREEVDHVLSGEGDRLEIALTPVATAAATADDTPARDVSAPPAELAYEPLPAESADLNGDGAHTAHTAATDDLQEMAPPAALASGPSPDAYTVDYSQAGTADAPVVAPPPSGRSAEHLRGVEIVPAARGTAVRVAGDGEFRYSTFALDSPHRFVIDLHGVINLASRSTLELAGDEVNRVRVAQFESDPDPVSRVVFDLSDRAVPQIERDADGLLVRFGTGFETSDGDVAAAASEPAPNDAGSFAGGGAENDRQVMAQGGSEVTAFDDGPGFQDETQPPLEEDGVEAPEDQLDEVEVVAEPEPVTPTVDVDSQIESEPAPPLDEPTHALQPTSTSDLELFSGGQVSLAEPADSASGTQSFTPQAVGGTERRFVGEPITFSLRDADLVETLRAFAVISGLNMVVQPGVSGTVTVQLEDVPWDQAFEQILKINNLGYELEGNVMRIAPTSVLQQEAEQRQRLEQARALSVPLLTVIRRLSYANAGTVSTLLRSRGGVLSQRGSVIVDQRTNTLIIKELPAVMDTVIAVIENLDIAEPQVMIEARIVETRKSFTRTLGVSWALDGVASPQTGNPTGVVFPATVDGSGGVNLVTGGDNGFLNLSLGSLAGTFNIDATLQAAENEGLVNVLSAPKVSTLNNNRAEIQSGFQIPIQTVSNNTVSVQFVNATLRLAVTPQVTAEGTILMEIDIQKRNPEFALQVAGATAAPISTQEARTRVIVRDGGTTVIGGIYEVTTNEGEDRVPGLANVPILGHLFKNRRREDQNTELLIFITPRVIRL